MLVRADGPTDADLDAIEIIQDMRQRAAYHRQQAAVLDVIVEELEDSLYGPGSV